MSSIHQSDITALTDCGYKLKHRLEADTFPSPKINAMMGTAYHAGLETHYKARLNGQPWAVSVANYQVAEVLLEHMSDADTDSMTFKAETTRAPAIVLTLDEAIEMTQELVTGYFTSGCSYVDDYGYTVVAVEEEWELSNPFDVTAEGKIAGRWDLLAHAPDKELVVVDWKTVRDYRANTADKWDPKKSPQPSLYWYAANQIHGSGNLTTPGTWKADVAFWNPAGPRSDNPGTRYKDFDIHVAEADVIRALQRAAMTGSAIRKQLFVPNPASVFCTSNWCEWWNICEFGGATVEVPF